MAEERKTIGTAMGVPIAGHASSISFVKDEIGRLEVTIGSVGGPALAALSPEQAAQLGADLTEEYGEPTPPEGEAAPKVAKAAAVHNQASRR